MNYLIKYLDEDSISNIYDTFEPRILNNLKEENIKEIIAYLQKNNVEVIEDMLINYLDLFILGIPEFQKKFNKLNKKYSYKLYEYLNYKLDILEEMEK